jgi:carboxylate-amine ligase
MKYQASEPFSLGMELELQLIDLSDFDLAVGASDLLAYLERNRSPSNVSPELTESMIEIACGIFSDWRPLHDALVEIRDELVKAADWLNLGICGGGTHPFQRWEQRRIFDSHRFKNISALYGYLAKQFTVYGQHIHVGCESGDAALQLLHGLNRYVPHFIALAASSPFFQGVDSRFYSSRLNSIAAFPLSGRAPFYLCWDMFIDHYYQPMEKTGIIRSMKDFYWDIRPKPEYGTIELRICDTPLTMFRAAALAGYFQLLCAWLRSNSTPPDESEYLVYSYNRFQACRFGMQGMYVHPTTHRVSTIRESMQGTLEMMLRECNTIPLRDVEATLETVRQLLDVPSDSDLLLTAFRQSGTLEDVVQFSMNTFRTK